MRLNEVWSHARATRAGFVAAMAALILWPLHAVLGAAVRPAFIAALAVTAACGGSLLFMGTADLLTIARSRRVLPARIFDLAFAAALTVPSVLALTALLA